jgi:hypothetical protein
VRSACVLAILLAALSVGLLIDDEGNAPTQHHASPAIVASTMALAPLALVAPVASVVIVEDVESDEPVEPPATPRDVTLVAYLDVRPLANARLRVGAREVLTDAQGRAAVVIDPGRIEVSAPDLIDAEACLVQAWTLRSERPVRGLIASFDGPPPRVGPALVGHWSHEEGPDHAELYPEDHIVLVRFLPPRIVTGDIIDFTTCAPIVGAEVVTRDARATTDATGAFRLAIPADRDAETEPPWLTVSALGQGTIVTRARDEPLRLRLRSPVGPLRGRVTDLDGRPLRAEVRIGMRRPDPVTGDVEDETTHLGLDCDEDGRFVVAGLTPGTRGEESAGPHAASVTLRARYPGYRYVEREVILTSKGEEIELRLPRIVQGSFRVVDATGQPIAGARVSSEAAPQVTDALGRVDLPAPEIAYIIVTADGYSNRGFEVRLPTDLLTVSLEAIARRPTSARPPPIPTGRARFWIEASDDQTWLNAAVEEEVGDTAHVGRERGRLERAQRLPAGHHTLVVSAADHRALRVPFDVTPEQEVVVGPLRLVRGGATLAIRPRWPSRPVASVRVSIVHLASGRETVEWLDALSSPDLPLVLSGLESGSATATIQWIGPNDEEGRVIERPLRLPEGDVETLDVDFCE